MRQILTYLSPTHDFNDEHKMAVKIQIDNSLRLGWEPKNIWLVTNFDYEYNGVKSLVIPDDNYASHFFPATKIYVIDYLFREERIQANLHNNLYWYHDFDCFQLNPFDEGEPDLGTADIGVTNYGRVPRLCSASIFFKNTSGDLFRHMKEEIETKKKGEEREIMRLRTIDEYKGRLKILNLTYALQKWNLWHSYCRSAKPIKAVHFHLTPDKYDFFVRANNRVKLSIIPEGLVEIFHKHNFNGN